MHYVYRLQSLQSPEIIHIGVTSHLRNKVALHNRREVAHTAEQAPWRLTFYSAFTRESRAKAFAAWLHSSEGRDFGRRHLWSVARAREPGA